VKAAPDAAGEPVLGSTKHVPVAGPTAWIRHSRVSPHGAALRVDVNGVGAGQGRMDAKLDHHGVHDVFLHTLSGSASDALPD